jgi:hypothetical protein
VAFFDDDPPTQQQRSPGPPRPPRPPRGPSGSSEQQTILARRAIAIGVFVIFILLVAFLLKGCVDASKRNGLKDYNASVNALASSSLANVTQALEVLNSPSAADAAAQAEQIDTLASDSTKLTDKARDLSTPGSLTGATWYITTSLGLRATALSRIADKLPVARGTSRPAAEAATAQIAGQMSALLSSDVLWQLRTTPLMREAFAEADVDRSTIQPSIVLTDQSWLNTATVANRIDGSASDPTEDTSTPAAPGTHGHGLISVAANGKTLTSGDVPTTVPAGSGLTLDVVIANQGENDETNVTVNAAGKKQDGTEVFDETKKVAKTTKGTQSTVRIPVTKPVTGSVNITVEVKPVKGEINKANNKQTYRVIFS